MPFPTFDKQDDVPEAFRADYVENNGKWVPKLGDDGAAVKAQNARLIDEKRKADERAANYEKLLGGRKPEEVEEIFTNHRTAEEERLKKAGEYDKMVSKRVKEKEDELLPRVTAGEAALRELGDLKFDIAIREQATKAGIPEKNLRAVTALAKAGLMKLVDGKLVVLDATGDARSITADKFFAEEFKTDYAELYTATGGAGGGAGGTGTERRAATPGTIDGRDQAAFLANFDKIGKGEMKVAL